MDKKKMLLNSLAYGYRWLVRATGQQEKYEFVGESLVIEYGGKKYIVTVEEMVLGKPAKKPELNHDECLGECGGWPKGHMFFWPHPKQSCSAPSKWVEAYCQHEDTKGECHCSPIP